LTIWRSTIYERIQERLTEAVLDQIQRARQGEQVATTVLKSTIDSLVALGLTKDKPEETNLRIYQTFEGEFLARTEIFFTQESSHFIETNSISDYMRKVETRLTEESRRRDAILHPSTESELNKRLEQVLIQKHMDRMHNEFSELLKQEKIEGMVSELISLHIHVADSRVRALPLSCRSAAHVLPAVARRWLGSDAN